MKHLRIEQGNTPETVNYKVIDKLYNLSKEDLDETSNLKGYLITPVAYGDAVDYLNEKWNDLTIQPTNRYIRFEDSAVKEKLLETLGDGVSITEAEAASTTSIPSFDGNTDIVKFNELSKFGASVIGNSNFFNCTNLEEIDLSNTWRLSDDVFRHCTNLSKIGSLVHLNNLGNNVFRDCTNLKVEVDLSSVKYPGTYSFYNSGITKVIKFGPVDIIRNSVFQNCVNLTSVTLSDETISFDNSAFNGCTSLSEINLNNITTLSNRSLGNTALEEINMPNLTNLGITAFIGCTKLKKVNNLGAITLVDNSVFNSCTALEEVVLPNTCTTIRNTSFYNCKSLNNINLSNIISIGSSSTQGSFEGCTSLESVDLSSCTSVGDRAFYGCISLKTVTFATDCTLGGRVFNAGGGALTTINGIEHIKSIGELCFSGDNSIKVFNLSGVTTITGLQVFAKSSVNSATNWHGNVYLKNFTTCTATKIYYNNNVYNNSVFSGYRIGSSSVPLHHYDILYFKELQQIIPGEIGLISGNIVINNATPPAIVAPNDETIDSVYPINRNNNDFSAGEFLIYVPDSAVNDYKNHTCTFEVNGTTYTSGWNVYADWIRPISDLTVVATEADLQDGQIALIQEYM